MDNVLMMIVVVAITMYPRKDTFYQKIKFKAGIKGIEFEISAKEKSAPTQSEHPNRN